MKHVVTIRNVRASWSFDVIGRELGVLRNRQFMYRVVCSVCTLDFTYGSLAEARRTVRVHRSMRRRADASRTPLMRVASQSHLSDNDLDVASVHLDERLQALGASRSHRRTAIFLTRWQEILMALRQTPEPARRLTLELLRRPA